MSGHRHPKDWHRCPDCGAEHKKVRKARGTLHPGDLGFTGNAADERVSQAITQALAAGRPSVVIPPGDLPYDPNVPGVSGTERREG